MEINKYIYIIFSFNFGYFNFYKKIIIIFLLNICIYSFFLYIFFFGKFKKKFFI